MKAMLQPTAETAAAVVAWSGVSCLSCLVRSIRQVQLPGSTSGSVAFDNIPLLEHLIKLPDRASGFPWIPASFENT